MLASGTSWDPGRRKYENKQITVIQLPMTDPFTVLFCVIPAQLGATALGPHSWRSRRALVGDLPRNPCIYSIHKDVQAPQLTLIGCQHPRSGRRGSGFAASGTWGWVGFWVQRFQLAIEQNRLHGYKDEEEASQQGVTEQDWFWPLSFWLFCSLRAKEPSI